MNQYLIPANSKKSQLIFSVFRPIDLILLLIGAGITLIFMFAIPGGDLTELVIKLAPVSISILLVMPIPYYHNVLVYIQEVIYYISKPTKYRWRGWCCTYVEPEQSEK